MSYDFYFGIKYNYYYYYYYYYLLHNNDYIKKIYFYYMHLFQNDNNVFLLQPNQMEYNSFWSLSEKLLFYFE